MRSGNRPHSPVRICGRLMWSTPQFRRRLQRFQDAEAEGREGVESRREGVLPSCARTSSLSTTDSTPHSCSLPPFPHSPSVFKRLDPRVSERDLRVFASLLRCLLRLLIAWEPMRLCVSARRMCPLGLGNGCCAGRNSCPSQAQLAVLSHLAERRQRAAAVNAGVALRCANTCGWFCHQSVDGPDLKLSQQG